MINQAAIAVCLIIKVSNRADAEVGKIMPKLLQVIFTQNFSFFMIGTAGHADDATMFAICSPLNI